MRTALACCLALSPLGALDAAPTTPAAAITTTAPAQPATVATPAADAYWQALKLLRDGKAADWPRARALLKQGTDAEYPPALNFVALCHLNRQHGYGRDKSRAANFFRLAAEQGNANARLFLGRCYAQGVGVRRDRAQAIAWFSAVLAPESDFSVPVPPADFFPPASGTAAPAGPSTLSGPLPVDPADQIRAAAHLALGQLYAIGKKPTEAQDHLVKAATMGANHNAGLYDAAILAAVNFAFGQGVPRDMKRADEMLALSKKLIRRNVLYVTHNMVEQKLVDDFAQADVEEDAAAETDKIETQLQVAIAGSFADPKSKSYDPKEAAKWYELAAEKNEEWAMLSLAFLHQEGRLGPPDPTKAFEWFKQAAEKGDHNLGWANLSICYERGLGTPADHAKAAEIWQKYREKNIVCHLGTIGQCPTAPLTYEDELELNKVWAEKKEDAHAQYLLGVRYLRGWGVDANLKTAARWFQRAAKSNHGAALHRLGLLYRDNGKLLGCDTLAEAKKKSFEYCTRSAATNDADGLFLLGYAYSEGVGCKPDEDKAIDAYQRCLALKPKYPGAHNNIANIYQARYFRAPKGSDEKEKLRRLTYEYFYKGDALKDDYAAFNLGILAYRGRLQDKDLRAAYSHFENAAARGYPAGEAHLLLGRMLENGEGVPASLREAAYHYRLAALADNQDALVSLCEIYITKPGFAQNTDRAIYWLSFLARRGNNGAVVAIGDALIRKGDYQEAFKLFKPMLDLDARYVSGATYLKGSAYERLSRLYRDGLGVKASPKRAAEYLKKAIELGNRNALYLQARDLVRQGQSAAAIPVLKRACEAGLGGAVYLMGTLVMKGEGVDRDLRAGYELFRRAANVGEVEAMVALAEGTVQKVPQAPPLDEALRYAEMAEECGDPRAARLIDQLSALQSAQTGATPTETGAARPL